MTARFGELRDPRAKDERRPYVELSCDGAPGCQQVRILEFHSGDRSPDDFRLTLAHNAAEMHGQWVCDEAADRCPEHAS